MQTEPELQNKHTEYEMSREEMWQEHMRKFNYAWRNHKQEWFVNHDTEGPYWSIFLLGQNMSTLNLTMFRTGLSNMMTE